MVSWLNQLTVARDPSKFVASEPSGFLTQLSQVKDESVSRPCIAMILSMSVAV
jgi:hypothetical protein